jgi:hypothetical protein
MGSQPPREHREVEHQRRVCKDELGQVHHHISLGLEGPGECLAPTALRRAVLVSTAAQRRGLFIEVDDGPATYRNCKRLRKAQRPISLHSCTCLPLMTSLTPSGT